VLFTINYCGDKIKKEELVKSSGETGSYIQSSSWDRQHGRLSSKCKQADYANGKYRDGVRVWTTLTGFAQDRDLGYILVKIIVSINLLKPNDIYICRTTALTSRRYILNIYSTNIHTEYFKHAA